MIRGCWINGIEQMDIAVTDRGLQYGDGLFETMAVFDGQCPHWQAHYQRLRTGCERLNIPLADESLLRQEIAHAAQGQAKAVIKLIVTTGVGGRGYARPVDMLATRIIMLHDWPAYPASQWQNGIALWRCDTRLGSNPTLAGIKHLNRLEQVLARSEWQTNDYAEGLMCDSHGNVIEATMSNIYIVQDNMLFTPKIDNCGVAGVMRHWVLENAPRMDFIITETELSVEEIKQADEVILSNSLIGLWPVKSFEACQFQPGPVYWALLKNLVKDYPVVDI
jgi:4-amino-4-deoxychorismate lyase